MRENSAAARLSQLHSDLEPATMLAHVALCCALAPQAATLPTAPPHTELVTTTHPVAAFATDPKQKTIYAITHGQELRAWNVKNGKTRWTTDGLPPTKLGCLLAIGKDMAATSLPGAAAYTSYDLKTGDRNSGMGGITAMQTGTALAVDPRDRWVWIGTDEGMMTRLTPGNLNAWSNRAMKNQGVTAIALDGKAKLLAVGGRDGTIQFLDSKSAKRTNEKQFEGHDRAIHTIAWGPKNKLVLSTSGSKVLVHAVRSAKLEASFDGHDADVVRIAAAQKWVASVDETGVVVLWSLKGGAELVRFVVPEASHGVVGLTVLHNGADLLTAAGTKILIWDVAAFGK